jgi:hypothetical protein
VRNPERRDSSNESEWNIHQDEHRMLKRIECHVQETCDDNKCQWDDKQESIHRPLLVLELATEGDDVAGRQLHMISYAPLHFRNKASQGTSAQAPNLQSAWIKLNECGERDASDDFGKPGKF